MKILALGLGLLMCSCRETRKPRELYTIGAYDFFTFCDASPRHGKDQEITITLPAVPDPKRTLYFKRTDSSMGTCIIKGNGHSIEGHDAVYMVLENQSVGLRFDGKEWKFDDIPRYKR